DPLHGRALLRLGRRPRRGARGARARPGHPARGRRAARPLRGARRRGRGPDRRDPVHRGPAHLRVLVTGATGFLGHYVVEALVARVREVVALARESSRTEPIEALGASVVRGSFGDVGALRRAAEVDAIVHAAGGGIVRSSADFYRGNTDTT